MLNVRNLKSEAIKWQASLQIAAVNFLAYKFNVFLMVLAPSIIFLLIRYNLWNSIFIITGKEEILSYSKAKMLDYQVWVFFINLVVYSYTSIDLAIEIRLGKITKYLLYPFAFWKVQLSGFLVKFGIQSIIGFITIFILYKTGYLSEISLIPMLQGFFLTFMIGYIWFQMIFITALFAFWLEETWAIRVMIYLIVLLLSGAIIPVDFFPPWLSSALDYTVFPYLTNYPVKLIIEFPSKPAWEVAVYLSFWAIILSCISPLIFRRGLKHYAASGI